MTATLARTFWAACVCGLLVLTGCQGQNTITNKPITTDPEPEWYEGTPRRPAPKPAPQAKPAPKPAGTVCSAIALPTGDRRTSGLLIEKCSPAVVTLNSEFDYTIKVTNLTDVTLSDVQVVDDLPDGYQLSNASDGGTAAGGKITWNLGKMAPRAAKTITVKGKPTAQGMLTNCVTGSYNMVACVETQVVQPAIQISKTGPAEVLLCDPINYQFVVKNPGTGPATNVVVVDTLPAGLETATGSKTVKFDVGTLAAGETRTLNARLKATKTGKYTNSAVVTADGNLTAKDSVTTTVRAPKLTISKTAPARTFIGKTVTYNIEVKNVGDGVAKSTVVTETLPAGATFVSASGGGEKSATGIVWRAGDLKPGDSKKYTVVVKTTGKGTLKNTASADATCADAVSDSAQTLVEGIPAILLEVVDNPDPVAIGDSTTYTITVTNQGSADGTNIKVVCKLEPQAEFVSGAGATNVSHRNRTITMAPVATLAPKKSVSWTVKVKAIGEADVRFAVEMTSNEIKRPVNETEATNFYK